MALTCDRCGTSDFAVKGKAFELSFTCGACRTVMCSNCAGRRLAGYGAIEFLCCYQCGSSDLREASIWAERLARGHESES